MSHYNGGDNVINKVVLEKALNKESLDKRFTENVSRAYQRMWENGDFLFGTSDKVNVSHSAGYKVFLIQQGLLGLFLVLISYYAISRVYPTWLGFFFFVWVIISFMQRIYFTWDAFLIPYILGFSNYCAIKKNQHQCG